RPEHPRPPLAVDGDGRTPQVSARRRNGYDVAPRAARVLAQQDLIATGLGRHVLEVARRVADPVVIGMMLELQMGEPNVSGGVHGRRRLILLLRIASEALERRHALGHDLAVEAVFDPAVWDFG